MPHWTGIWRSLPEPLRHEAAAAFWSQLEEQPDPVLRAAACDLLARRYRFRAETVRRMPIDRRIEFLGRRLDLNEELAFAVLRDLHLGARRPMLIRFLDELSIPHADGLIDDDAQVVPTVDDLARAIGGLRGEFRGGDVELYLDVLEAGDRDAWANLPEARRAAAAAPSGDVPPAEEPVEPVAAADRLPDAETFTTLDLVLRDAVVGSVSGEIGGLSAEQARDLVEEAVQLNPRRRRTYFHLGFLDVLQDRPAEPRMPEAEEECRGWYLCGALVALGRQDRFAEIGVLLDRFPRDARRLGSGEHAGAELAAPAVLAALCETGRGAEVPHWVQAGGVCAAWDALRGRLMREVVGRLRMQDVEEAEPMLELLEAGARLRMQAGLPPSHGFQRDLTRRRAHCCRLRRDWQRAAELLERLVREQPGERTGMLLADLGLVRCRLRSLGEVRLPRVVDQLPDAARLLEQGRAEFERSAAAQGRGGHGEYCLGVLHLAHGERTEATPLLEAAVARMARNPEVYTVHEILPRARLYLACCLASSMDSERAGRAVELLQQSVPVLHGEADWLVADALGHLALSAPKRTSELLRALGDLLDGQRLEIALQADLLRQLPELRRTLAERAARTTRTREQRFDDWEGLLHAALEAGDEAAGLAALDGMESLADDEPERERFLDLLQQPGRIGSLWDTEELRFARIGLYESRGEYAIAASLLQETAHALLHDRGEEALREVSEYLARVRGFGLVPDEALIRRVDALAAESRRDHARAAAVGVPPAARGTILFLGGNERQQRYDEAVLDHVRRRWAGIRLVIRHPGWGSNWGRQLQRMRHDFDEADAVVLMRFMRTNFGREARKLCNLTAKRWFACTGHGRDSICAAIDEAAESLRGRESSDVA